MRERRGRPGVTLVELVATLAILGMMAGIAGVAYWRAEPVAALDEADARLGAARQQAVRRRKPVTITVRIDGRIHDATALPDGSIVFDGPAARDPLAGSPDDAT